MCRDILDKAIKFGAGRYRQEQSLLNKCGEEIRRFGRKVYIIAGPTAYKAAAGRLLPSLSRAQVEYVVTIYEGACCYEAAEALGKECLAHNCDEVVGIGGGKIMDLAKAAAQTAGLGVINIPTSIATCAAFAAMSVMYTQDGRMKNNWRYDHEADAVLVDLDVIAKCPCRYAAAGILDAMAKRIEIQNGRPVMRPEETEIDLYTAFRISEYTYDMLERYGLQAIADIKRGEVTKAVEYVTFINIAVTGMIANITRNFNQSALAHMIYYGARTFFTDEAKAALHGEIVAVGLFAQLYYNRLEDEMEKLKAFMGQMDMPLSLEQLGIAATAENLKCLENYLIDSPYVEPTGENLARLHQAMGKML